MVRREPQLIVLNENTKKECNFCGSDIVDVTNFGHLYEIEDVVAHYYCVLLSHKMRQRGKDNQGILGFLLADVRAEIKRANKIKCSYCGLFTASLQCSSKKCKLKFHLPCGMKNGSMHQFMKLFLSFCHEHRPKQEISSKALCEAESQNPICAVCYELVDYKSETETIWAPCCSKTWYHRSCVQKLATNAGYFFKCAICNNVDDFKKHMQTFGIFVPEQDASWELEPNAFEELYIRYNNCDAEECKNPNGRKHSVEATRWEIVLCQSCGSQGIHIGCGRLKYTDPLWECPSCSKVPGNADKSSGASASSVSSISSSSSSEGFRIGRRNKNRRSRSLENRSGSVNRRYRLRLRGVLQAKKRAHLNKSPNNESQSDSSLDDKSLSSLCSRENEEAPPSLADGPSSATKSTFSRSDQKRRSEPLHKRKRKIDKSNEEEIAQKDLRKKRRSVSDENLKPTFDNAQEENSNKDEKSKADGVQSSSRILADSENTKESSELEKEENPKDENKKNFSQELKLRPGPLRFKLAALRKAGKDPREILPEIADDDIVEIPKPEKKTVLIDLSDSDESTESEIDVEEVRVTNQPNISMYRVKKEYLEVESDDEVLEVVETSANEENEKTEKSIDFDMIGNKSKVIDPPAASSSAKVKLLVVKTEPEGEDVEKGEALHHVEAIPVEKETKKEVEKTVEIKKSSEDVAKVAVESEMEVEEKVKIEEKIVIEKTEMVDEADQPEAGPSGLEKEASGKKVLAPSMIESLKTIDLAPDEKLCEFEGGIYIVKKTGNSVVLVPLADAKKKDTKDNIVASTAVVSTVTSNPPADTVTSNAVTTASTATSNTVIAAEATSGNTEAQKTPENLIMRNPERNSVIANNNPEPVKTVMTLSERLNELSKPVQSSVSVQPDRMASSYQMPSSQSPVNNQFVNNPVRNPQSCVSRSNPPPYRPWSTSSGIGTPANYPRQTNQVPTTGFVQYPAPRPQNLRYSSPNSSSVTYSSPNSVTYSSPVRFPQVSSNYIRQPVARYPPVQTSQAGYTNVPSSQSQYSQYSQSQQSPTSNYAPESASQLSFSQFEVVGALKPLTNQDYVLSPSTTGTTYRTAPPQYTSPSGYSTPQSVPHTQYSTTQTSHSNQATYSAPQTSYSNQTTYSTPQTYPTQSVAYSARQSVYSTPSASYSSPQTSHSTPQPTPSYTQPSQSSQVFQPRILDVCSLATDNQNAEPPRKSSTQVSPARKHTRKQQFPQSKPPTLHYQQSPSQIQGVRNAKPVAAVTPSTKPPKTPPKPPAEFRKRSEDNDDIVIIDEKKPPIPPLVPVPELRNRPSRPKKKNDKDDQVVIELD